MNLYFSDVFEVSEKDLEKYGAFNISLVTDLPLFIDPFLLFNSRKPVYKFLHNNMIGYLRFLKNKSTETLVTPGLLKSWYHFSEVKQTWLGFCEAGNRGRGLGARFARSLNNNLNSLFSEFGNESITQGSHLEKLCLIDEGVGRDMISDFTTNLIKYYLLEFTQKFAIKFIKQQFRKKVAVNRVFFNYNTEVWISKTFELPFYDGNYILLTPKDILTRDNTWINRTDLIDDFEDIPKAIDNDILRAQINNYFDTQLPKKPSKKDYERAARVTIIKFPELIDYYIKYKEDRGDEAKRTSIIKVLDSHKLYIEQFGDLIRLLAQQTQFYEISGNTKKETAKRIEFFKDVVENKSGWRLFYVKGQPVRKETDVHIFFRLTWFRTPSDVSREVNNGRGPVDYKISRGSQDKTLVEFKLASNPQLKRNLQRQLEIYQRASNADIGYKVIIYFTKQELVKVEKILAELKLSTNPNIILIDARKDNKPSASKA